jgi:hypothetical protein
LDDRSAEATAMMTVILKILAGYGLAAAAATAVALVQMPILFGGALLGWKDSVGAYLVIAVFAWFGIPFALLAARRGWSKPVTYMGGGSLAMAVGVASIFALALVHGEINGYARIDGETLAKAARNIAEMLALGILPGVAGGLTYWMIAAPRPSR